MNGTNDSWFMAHASLACAVIAYEAALHLGPRTRRVEGTNDAWFMTHASLRSAAFTYETARHLESRSSRAGGASGACHMTHDARIIAEWFRLGAATRSTAGLVYSGCPRPMNEEPRDARALMPSAMKVANFSASFHLMVRRVESRSWDRIKARSS